MSSKTTNYELHKIDLTDAPPDITVLNQNWDTIDEALHETAGLSGFGLGEAKTVNYSEIDNLHSNGWYRCVVNGSLPSGGVGEGIWIRVDSYGSGNTFHTIYDTNGNIVSRMCNGGKWGDYVHVNHKITGTYTGNGSSASRTISTGCYGSNLILICGGLGDMALVTPEGSIYKETSTLSGTNTGVAYFENGDLKIATTNACFNENGTTYTYHVL